MKKKILKIAAVLAGIYVLVIGFFFTMAMARWFPVTMEMMFPKNLKEKLRSNQEKLHAMPMEDVTIRSFDGLKLVGHLIPAEGAKRTVIMCHGWRSSWDVDFCAQALWFHETGCNLLMIEERGQGESEGTFMTYGVKERQDIRDWAVWYAAKDDSLPVYLYGTSMGGASVLMTAGEELPDCVRGIIADSAFTSPYEELKDFGKRLFHLPEHPFMDSMAFVTRMIAGYDLKDYSTTEALSKCRIPVLLFHGTNDMFVSDRMTADNARAGGELVEVHVFEGVAHCSSFAAEPETYKSAVTAFFENAES